MQHDTTPSEILLALTLIKVVLVAAALVFIYFSLRAYLRYRSPRMLALTAAVVFITIGAVAEGVAIQTDVFSLDYAHLFESVLLLIGFLLLLYSLFAPATRSHRETAELPPEGGEDIPPPEPPAEDRE